MLLRDVRSHGDAHDISVTSARRFCAAAQCWVSWRCSDVFREAVIGALGPGPTAPSCHHRSVSGRSRPVNQVFPYSYLAHSVAKGASNSPCLSRSLSHLSFEWRECAS